MTDDTTRAEALLPCPFCGSGDLEACSNAVSCNECSASVIDDDGPVQAITAWNRRQSPPSAEPVAWAVYRRNQLVYFTGATHPDTDEDWLALYAHPCPDAPAVALLREARDALEAERITHGHGHWDSTMKHGAGCEICIRQREASKLSSEAIRKIDAFLSRAKEAK